RDANTAIYTISLHDALPISKENNIQSYRLRGFEVKPESDFLESRKIVLTNSDCHIALAAPTESMKDYFYKNTDSDEVIFIHKGTDRKSTRLNSSHVKISYAV